jgi:1-phosphatidylinositol phosphodiesterase
LAERASAERGRSGVIRVGHAGAPLIRSTLMPRIVLRAIEDGVTYVFSTLERHRMIRSLRRSARLVSTPVFLIGVGALALACDTDPSDGNQMDAAMEPQEDSGSSSDAGSDSGSMPSDAGSDASDAASNDAGPTPDAGDVDAGDTDAGTRTNANWMGAIGGSTSVAALSIPGTHDTGARFEDTPGTLKTQDLTVPEQLAAGVRYFDIRCKDVSGKFDIYHKTKYQMLSLDQVLESIFEHFAANPGETLIMSVKQEQPPENSTATFEETFDTYTAQHPDRWYLAPTIPTLDQARGKIILMRRFGVASTPKGLDATAFADNTTFTIDNGPAAKLRIQDYYEPTDNPAKWMAITDLLTEAKQGDLGTLFLNNTSAYFPLEGGAQDILSVSNVINPQVESYFTTNTSGRYGIVAMDFVDVAKSTLIVNTNFE